MATIPAGDPAIQARKRDPNHWAQPKNGAGSQRRLVREDLQVTTMGFMDRFGMDPREDQLWSTLGEVGWFFGGEAESRRTKTYQDYQKW